VFFSFKGLGFLFFFLQAAAIGIGALIGVAVLHNMSGAAAGAIAMLVVWACLSRPLGKALNRRRLPDGTVDSTVRHSLSGFAVEDTWVFSVAFALLLLPCLAANAVRGSTMVGLFCVWFVLGVVVLYYLTVYRPGRRRNRQTGTRPAGLPGAHGDQEPPGTDPPRIPDTRH
jgi:hypothetical protein